MRTRITLFLGYLRTSFWGIPGGLVILAIVAAFSFVEIDQRHASEALEIAPWLANISAEGTASLLGTVATSVLTLAGVTFSGTLVALTLASSQFGPRLLRNFRRSRLTQITLGILLATYAYALIVMRNVRMGEETFVPHLAALIAFILTLLSLTLFILFIHSVIQSIQAENVVAEVHAELERSIDHFFGEENAPDDQDDEERARQKASWEEAENESCLHSSRCGYLQGIDMPSLVAAAKTHDLKIRVLCNPGHYIVRGQALAAWRAKDLSDEHLTKLRNHFVLGSMRTAEQDLEYCIRQLVEVALRALSPGVNDPFTAMNCIDHLGGAMVSITQKRLPAHHHHDADGTDRVHTPPATYAGFLGSAFDQIRQAAAGKPDVTMRILETLYQIGQQCRTHVQFRAVQEQARLTLEMLDRDGLADADAEEIDARYAKVRNLNQP